LIETVSEVFYSSYMLKMLAKEKAGARWADGERGGH
jgi:hypothetical protein